MSIAVIGSTTKDRIIIEKQGKDYSQTGGGVYYSSLALAALGMNVVAIPLLSQEDASMLDALNHPRITIHPIWTSETTTYFMRFPHDSMDICEKKLLAMAENAQWDDNILERISAVSAIHVSPLSPKEFDFLFYKKLRQHFKGLISIDGQGFVRGTLPPVRDMLSGNVDILKCDDQEILQLTQCNCESSAIQEALSWGISEILVTRASQGSTVYTKTEMHHISAVPPKTLIDTTGCGDSYVVAYLHQRTLKHAPQDASEFASHVASKNAEHQGALIHFDSIAFS